jgi:DNA primase
MIFAKRRFFSKRRFDGAEREKPEFAPKEATRERNAQEDLEEDASAVVNAPLDFALQRLEYDHPYLRERGFTDETIKTFGLGYCHRGLSVMPVALWMRKRSARIPCGICFPGAGSATAPATSSFRVGNASQLVVVESFTAVWWLTQAGITNVVALMGASCSETQAGLVRDLVPEGGSIWLFPDGDKAGERMAEETLAMLAPYRFVRWVKLEEGQQPTDLSSEGIHTLLPLT